jgi:hypothetical protein
MPPGAAPDAAFANRRDVLTAQIPSFRLRPRPARRRPLAIGLDLRDGRHHRIARLDDIVASLPAATNPEDRNP